MDQYVGRDKRQSKLHSVDLDPVTHKNKEPAWSHFAGALGEMLLPSQFFAIVTREGESHASADR